MPVPTVADRAARVHGLLLGTAIGDARGAVEPGTDDGSSPLRYTDDTALTIVVADHVAAGAGGDPVDEDALAAELAAAWQAEPWRGYGSGAARTFAAISAGTPWREAARSAFGGAGSFGNGAAMRVAPVAVVGSGVHDAADLGERTATVTHAHVDGAHGARWQAAAVHLVLQADPGVVLDADRLLDDLGRVVLPRAWHERLERIGELVHVGVTPQHAAHALGNDVAAIDSVPLALLAFLVNADSPAATIDFAIAAGGDTDTIAAMAGALAGARHGAGGFPATWTGRLEGADRLAALAERLTARRAPSTADRS